MNKTTMMGMVLAGALGAFAGVDNVAITFSTPGPDTYGDGRPVLDGECYALVWTPSGEAFGGIDSDGAAVAPSKVVLRAPVAKGGRCPNILFEIDEGYAKANFPGGTWRVVLLDTRRFATDADGVVVNGEDGLPKVAGWGEGSSLVNGYGETGAAVGGTMFSANAKGTVAADAPRVTPEKGRNLRIRDMRLVDGNVYLYVEGSLSSALYGVRSGTEPGKLVGKGERRYGKTDGDLIIIKPQKEGGEFFAMEEVK